MLGEALPSFNALVLAWHSTYLRHHTFSTVYINFILHYLFAITHIQISQTLSFFVSNTQYLLKNYIVCFSLLMILMIHARVLEEKEVYDSFSKEKPGPFGILQNILP